jgi:hypothetical protein
MSGNSFDPAHDLPESTDYPQTAEGELGQQKVLTETERELMQLFHIADLGDDMRRFLATAPGEFIYARAKSTILDRAYDMLEVDITDTKRLRKLQADCSAARLVLKFINEAITEGDQAREIISTHSPV